ncbi:hypothetical protein WDV93_00695 [Pantoea ananatis]
MILTQVQLPAGSSMNQTSAVVAKVEKYYLTKEKDNVLSVFSTIGSGPGRERAERRASVYSFERLG